MHAKCWYFSTFSIIWAILKINIIITRNQETVKEEHLSLLFWMNNRDAREISKEDTSKYRNRPSEQGNVSEAGSELGMFSEGGVEH